MRKRGWNESERRKGKAAVGEILLLGSLANGIEDLINLRDQHLLGPETICDTNRKRRSGEEARQESR